MKTNTCIIFFLPFMLGCHDREGNPVPEGVSDKASTYADPVIVVDLFPDCAENHTAPLVTRELDDLDVPVRFSLRNNSDRDFHYYGMGRYGPTKDSIQGCPIRLYKGDALIPHRKQIEGAGLFPRHKRVLRPGEEIPYEVALDSYGVDHKPDTLTEGQYKLRLEYSLKPGGPLAELRCTPIELDRTIMILELERP